MYHLQLLAEIEEALPNTPAQNERIRRAVAECATYRFSDAFETYQEPAVRIDHEGKHYVCFMDGQCTCPDWSNRGSAGTGEIEQCKHSIAAYISGQFTVPTAQQQREPEAAPLPEPPTAPEEAEPVHWRDAEPIGWEYIPGVGEVPCYAPEVVEAYSLHICND